MNLKSPAQGFFYAPNSTNINENYFQKAIDARLNLIDNQYQQEHMFSVDSTLNRVVGDVLQRPLMRVTGNHYLLHCSYR
ncbi:hypothetical protein CEX98_16035 [Pseudoalteromonas piscicida]|uniref:Uncharacterized protein n=1 Tax=Pseudoalteromonas piscicida TaxID=43662 RepID=A0A2A5JMN5_PSEO7|nr:hypothetical protein CEX98_16035 [Pseudoalteromonas piscicida]